MRGVDRLLRRKAAQPPVGAGGEPDSIRYRVYKAAFVKVHGEAEWETFMQRHSTDPLPPWEIAEESSRVYRESLDAPD